MILGVLPRLKMHRSANIFTLWSVYGYTAVQIQMHCGVFFGHL